MARINSLLSIVVDQGANELRLGSDREPKMLAFGSPTKLSMPKMNNETVRALLGELLTTESEAAMRDGGRVELAYDAGALGSFAVVLTRQDDGGVSAVFVRSRAEAPKPHPPDVPAAAPATSITHDDEGHVTHVAPTGADDASQHGLGASPVIPREPTEALQSIVARAVSLRASDVHLADGDRAFARVDGALHALDGVTPSVCELLGVEPGTVGHSLETAFDVPRVGRVRVHAYATESGLAAAIRLLPSIAPAFDALHMPVPFNDLVMLPHGLVIVCGATGSGKSSTLAALAYEAMRKRSIVLVTLEDPIEYVLTAPEGSIVRRRQIGREVASFASGLRDALREDTDVLLVGEMRDAETIALAMTAAETGHLVLASLHSRGAASAIERIVDAYSEGRRDQVRVQLAESLRAVIGQRLVVRARGVGRVPAIEVLRVNHAVGALIREGRTAQIASAIQSGRREGMISLERCLADRVRAGDITLEAAKATANDPESLTTYLAKG
jgi:twitching motility protein PilT